MSVFQCWCQLILIFVYVVDNPESFVSSGGLYCEYHIYRKTYQGSAVPLPLFDDTLPTGKRHVACLSH